MELYIITFVTCLFGSFIQSTTGFGFAILAMSILPFIIPYKTATIVVLLLTTIFTLQNSYHFRKHIKLKFVLPVLLASFAGRTIGIVILMALNTDVLRVMLGITLIAFSIYFAAFSGRLKIRPSIKNGAISGVASGIIGGLFNTGGPPLVVYYFSALEDKNEYLANLHFTFALSALYSSILHIAYGNISLEIIKITLVSTVAVSAGGAIGLYFFRKVNKDLLCKAIYSFMALSGILLIIKT